VAALARDPRVMGLKDSAGDFEVFLSFLAVKRRRPDFRVLQGNEYLAAASLLAGGDGLVPGLANVAPALFVGLRAAAASGDVPACARTQMAIRDLASLYAAAGHWLPALKAACALLGIGAGVPGAPLLPASEAERRRVGAVLRRHGLLGRARRGAAGGGRLRAGGAR
jgi:4-hydroxy-tetrahydrodipicolinate synthase